MADYREHKFAVGDLVEYKSHDTHEWELGYVSTLMCTPTRLLYVITLGRNELFGQSYLDSNVRFPHYEYITTILDELVIL